VTIQFPERFNMADYFLYHNVEEGREHKVCLYFEDKTWTYGDVVRKSNQAGNALRKLGVQIENRVLIVLPDTPEFVWTWFGTARIGAVITMVNPLLPANDYRYYLEYTRATAVVIHRAQADTFAEAVKDANWIRFVLVVGAKDDDPLFASQTSGPGWYSFDSLVASQSEECPPAPTLRDDIAIWLFTSGSTGHPKGAVHLQHDLPFNTEVFAKQTIGVSENDLTVSVPKLFFGYATGTNLLFPFAVGGATALFAERSTP
jgi:benzoate-CoA ligase